MNNTPKADVGIIIGRFQVDKLTEAHQKLIQKVLDKHEKVIVFLGVSGISPVPSTKRNPLDFESRKQMLEEYFPKKLIISHIKDMKSDEKWSLSLDEKIMELVSPNQSIMLYGGRDSFIQYYTGKYPTEELEPEVYLSFSGTEIRKQLKVKAEASNMFRAGVIWANENQFNHSIAVVDVAVFNEDYTKILLGRKENENKYRFFGGFVDITDNSYEETAKREVSEEAGIEIVDIKYVCSKRISDWRYKYEKDEVFTTLFSAKYSFGSVKPNDDIVECRWTNIIERNSTEKYLDIDIVDEHSILLKELFKKLDVIKN